MYMEQRIQSSRMTANATNTSQTADQVARVKREPAIVAQIHAPALPAAVRLVHGRIVYLIEVVLDVRARHPAGRVPVTAGEHGGASFVIVVVEPVGRVLRVHGVRVEPVDGHEAGIALDEFA